MALTDTKIRGIKATGSRFDLPDRDGLVLRVSQSGKLSWSLSYRVHGSGSGGGARKTSLAGPKRRLQLGEYPTISLAEARAIASETKRLARSGIDAAAPKLEPSARTVSALFERYRVEHLERNISSGPNVVKLLERHVLSRWADVGLANVNRSEFLALLEEVRTSKEMPVLTPKGRETMQTRGGKGSAAEVRKWTRAMFQFGVEVDLLPSNPLADVRNRDRQTPRDRVLQMEELRQIWSAATALAHPWGHLFKLLMLTGSRRSEWANARVDWLKAESTILEVPAEQYKTRKPQVVPLSTQAQAIVRSLPQGNNGPFLFSTTGGLVPVSGFSKAKTQLDQQITMQKQSLAISWVTHDLRRSMATHMERLGIEPHVIELCLGHKLTGIAATYRHYGYLPEKQVALQRWADELLA